MADGGVEASVISVPDGPTLAAHEISTLSFTQAFAIYKVPSQLACCVLKASTVYGDAVDTDESGMPELRAAALHARGPKQWR